MKTGLSYFIIFTGVLFLHSCMPITRISSGKASTEHFIKNFVEKHNEGEYSTIKTCLIFSGPAISGGSLELTGHKYRNEKNLVIAASQSYSSVPAQEQGTQTQVLRETEAAYIQLTFNQAKLLTENYKVLEEKIKNEQPKAGETIYHDFTASPDLFVSYNRSYRTLPNQSATYMHLWVKGKKCTVYSSQIVKQLEEFLSY